jgi:hypothetical protein
VFAPTPEKSVFDGLDTTLVGIAALSGLPEGALARPLGEAQSAAVAARDGLDVRTPGRVVPEIARGLQALREALVELSGVAASPEARDEARFLLETKERDFMEALARSVGLQVDALADQETLAPGESATVTVQAFVADRDRVELGTPELRSRGGFTIVKAEAPSPTPLTRRRRTEAPDLATAFRVTAEADAPPTVPYWLERPRNGNAYDWPKDDRRSLAFGPPPLEA